MIPGVYPYGFCLDLYLIIFTTTLTGIPWLLHRRFVVLFESYTTYIMTEKEVQLGEKFSLSVD